MTEDNNICLHIKINSIDKDNVKKCIMSKTYPLDGIENIFMLTKENIDIITDFRFNYCFNYIHEFRNSREMEKDIMEMSHIIHNISETLDKKSAKTLCDTVCLAYREKYNSIYDENTKDMNKELNHSSSKFDDFIPIIIEAELSGHDTKVLRDATYGISYKDDSSEYSYSMDREQIMGYFICSLKNAWPNDVIFNMLPNFRDKEIYIDFGHGWRMYIVNEPEFANNKVEYSSYDHWMFKWYHLDNVDE